MTISCARARAAFLAYVSAREDEASLTYYIRGRKIWRIKGSSEERKKVVVFVFEGFEAFFEIPGLTVCERADWPSLRWRGVERRWTWEPARRATHESLRNLPEGLRKKWKDIKGEEERNFEGQRMGRGRTAAHITWDTRCARARGNNKGEAWGNRGRVN